MTNDIRGTMAYDFVHSGEFPLTKRELFVLVVAQGMLSNPEVLHGHAQPTAEDIVKRADALMLQINQQEPQPRPKRH